MNLESSTRIFFYILFYYIPCLSICHSICRPRQAFFMFAIKQSKHRNRNVIPVKKIIRLSMMTIHTEMTSENFGATERKNSRSFPDPPSTSYQLSLVIFFCLVWFYYLIVCIQDELISRKGGYLLV